MNVSFVCGYDVQPHHLNHVDNYISCDEIVHVIDHVIIKYFSCFTRISGLDLRAQLTILARHNWKDNASF